MIIVHITRDFPPRYNGGLSSAVGGMVTASREAGLGCQVISFDSWRPKARPGDALEPVLEDRGRVLRLGSPAQLPAALKQAASWSFDLIQVHNAMLFEFGQELRNLCHPKNPAPIIKSVHLLQQHMNDLRRLDKETMSLAAQKHAFAQASRLVAPSQAVADYLVQNNPQLEPKVRVASLGVCDGPGARTACAQPNNRRPGSLIYAGRFADLNGTAELFESIPLILKSYPDASFTIAGGQPENKRSERRWLKRFTEGNSSQVLSRVRFTGWLSPEELSREYGRSLVQLVPSWFETFGQTALEGMLHGLPLVASRTGGLQELIDHGQTGVLVEPRRVDTLVSAALDLLTHPQLALELGARAADQVRQTRLWHQVIGDLVSVYEEVV